MTRFSDHEHTATNLGLQIEGLYRSEPDLLIVGSLGRSALYDSIYGNASYEFEQRQEDPLHDGTIARDIDIVSGNLNNELRFGPFKVDGLAFNNRSVTITKDGEDWVLQSADRKFSETLHPAVMEPVSGKAVFGIELKTLPLQTQLALYRSRGQLRRKDLVPEAILHRALESGNQPLPSDMYLPFNRLSQITPNIPMRGLRSMYRRYAPKRIDVIAGPFIDFINR